jgi:hypothetical protein
MFALSFAHQHRYIVQMFSNELAARRVSTRTDFNRLGNTNRSRGRALGTAHSLIWSSSRFIDRRIPNLIGRRLLVLCTREAVEKIQTSGVRQSDQAVV